MIRVNKQIISDILLNIKVGFTGIFDSPYSNII